MNIFEKTKKYPKEERSSLRNQMRRSYRKVCPNSAEGHRNYLYAILFLNKNFAYKQFLFTSFVDNIRNRSNVMLYFFALLNEKIIQFSSTKFSLTDNIKYILMKLSDADMKNSETQVWINFSLACEYIENKTHGILMKESLDARKLLGCMIQNPQKIK